MGDPVHHKGFTLLAWKVGDYSCGTIFVRLDDIRNGASSSLWRRIRKAIIYCQLSPNLFCCTISLKYEMLRRFEDDFLKNGLKVVGVDYEYKIHKIQRNSNSHESSLCNSFRRLEPPSIYSRITITNVPISKPTAAHQPRPYHPFRQAPRGKPLKTPNHSKYSNSNTNCISLLCYLRFTTMWPNGFKEITTSASDLKLHPQ